MAPLGAVGKRAASEEIALAVYARHDMSTAAGRLRACTDLESTMRAHMRETQARNAVLERALADTTRGARERDAEVVSLVNENSQLVQRVAQLEERLAVQAGACAALEEERTAVERQLATERAEHAEALAVLEVNLQRTREQLAAGGPLEDHAAKLDKALDELHIQATALERALREERRQKVLLQRALAGEQGVDVASGFDVQTIVQLRPSEPRTSVTHVRSAS